MKSQRFFSLMSLSDRTADPGKAFRLAVLAMVAVIVTNQIQAQGLNIVSADTSSSSAAAVQQAAPAPQPAPLVSAPVPAQQQEAKLTDPLLPDAHLTLARPGDTQNNLTSAPAKPQHKALALTGAIVGTVVLLAGVGGFALSEQCKTPTAGACGGIHNAGIGMMVGGGAAAGAGFFFLFHKPSN